MTWRVVMCNSAGELDNRPAKDGTDALRVLADMLLEQDELQHDDTFKIIDDEEDA